MPVPLLWILLCAGGLAGIITTIAAWCNDSGKGIIIGISLIALAIPSGFWLHAAWDQPHIDVIYAEAQMHVVDGTEIWFIYDFTTPDDDDEQRNPKSGRVVNLNKQFGVKPPKGAIVRIYKLKSPYCGVFWFNSSHKYQLICPGDTYEKAKSLVKKFNGKKSD